LLRAAGCTMVRQGRGSHEIWHSPITKRNFAVPIGIPSRHTANAILRQAGSAEGFLSVLPQLVRRAAGRYSSVLKTMQSTSCWEAGQGRGGQRGQGRG
jgi:hypothetical protein